MYSFLHALSNVFPLLRSLLGLPGMQIVLIFTCFEQCALIFEVTPRTAGSADCIDSCMLSAIIFYV